MRFASRLLRGNSYSFSHINLCTSLTYGNSYCIEPTTPTPTATYLNKKNESCIEPTTAPYVLRLLRLRKLLFMIFLIQLSCWTPIGKKQLLRFRVSHETENSHSDYHRYTELRRYEIYLAWGGRPTNLKREFLLNRVFSVFDASTHYAVNPAGQSSRADSDASDTGWLWGKRKRSDPQLILRIVIALGASHEQILIVKNDHTYSIPISVPSRKNSHKIQSGGFIRRTLKRRTIHYQGLQSSHWLIRTSLQMKSGADWPFISDYGKKEAYSVLSLANSLHQRTPQCYVHSTALTQFPLLAALPLPTFLLPSSLSVIAAPRASRIRSKISAIKN